ncbi:MAG: hypothetical protein TQ37_02530 [Candidatus Synechococcus spongiarum 15L]|uniref:Polymerase nucleotidyl transferase domain-containing protein n=1 Tax=Candidatus Synechococcus spongiarum 15L TaxID=1608419 RepID=A0A0G8AXF1_9SYNE|nr:MAG: hypothetical protein TQ37_02530 [Candidatus Synechococcus spongiarum 15L]
MSTNPPWSQLQEETHAPLRGFLRSIKKQKSLESQASIVYGSAARGEFLQGYSNINVLIVLEYITQPALQQWSGIHKQWAREKIIAPLFLTHSDLQQFSDVFPLEFLDIKEYHVLLEGRDPFPELHVDATHLFRQCRQETHANLLRVRQCYVEGWAKVEAIQTLLPLSLTALLPCLRGLYRLLDRPSNMKSPEVLDELNATLDVDPSVFLEVWRLKRGLSTPGKHELPKLLERYLAGLGQLVDRIDSMKHEGRFQ